MNYTSARAIGTVNLFRTGSKAEQEIRKIKQGRPKTLKRSSELGQSGAGDSETDEAKAEPKPEAKSKA